MGLRLDAVRISIAEAAIDVDNAEDRELAEAILRARAEAPRQSERAPG